MEQLKKATASNEQEGMGTKPLVTTMMSYSVFMSFVDGEGKASRILSRDCFTKWLSTRKTFPKQPEESFRRVLVGHICGIDRRRPFPAHVESCLLSVIRKREVWDCFKGTNVSIGIRGFRKQGFHELKRIKNMNNTQTIVANQETQSLSSRQPCAVSSKRKFTAVGREPATWAREDSEFQALCSTWLDENPSFESVCASLPTPGEILLAGGKRVETADVWWMSDPSCFEDPANYSLKRRGSSNWMLHVKYDGCKLVDMKRPHKLLESEYLCVP